MVEKFSVYLLNKHLGIFQKIFENFRPPNLRCCGKTDSECQTFLEQTLIVQPAEEFSGETAAQVD